VRNLRAVYVFLSLVLSFTLIGCAGRHVEIKQGATLEAVEKELGKPRGFHRRWMPQGEVREIWVYHDRGISVENHLYPNTRMVVFSNGKVIAENPQDPYAPREILASHK